MFTLESGKCLCRQLAPSTKTLITPSPTPARSSPGLSGRRWGAREWDQGSGVGGSTCKSRWQPGAPSPALPCPLLVPAEGPSPVTCEFRNCLLWAICPPPAPQVWLPASPEPSRLWELFCAESDTEGSHSFRGVSRGYCEGAAGPRSHGTPSASGLGTAGRAPQGSLENNCSPPGPRCCSREQRTVCPVP